jgi:hypothetical protein
MPEINCPECGISFEVADDAPGSRAKCEGCDHEFRVAAPGARGGAAGRVVAVLAVGAVLAAAGYHGHRSFGGKDGRMSEAPIAAVTRAPRAAAKSPATVPAATPTAPAPAAPVAPAPASSPAALPAPRIDLSPYTFEHAADLLRQARAADALACARGAEERLAPADRLARWQGEAREFADVVCGRATVYLVEMRHGSHPPAALPAGLRPVVPAGPPQAFTAVVHCVDPATGRLKWSRRIAAPPGDRPAPFPLLLDPANDDLLVWGVNPQRLAADTGDDAPLDVQRGTIEPVAVRNREHLYVRPASRPRRTEGQLPCLDLATGLTQGTPVNTFSGSPPLRFTIHDRQSPERVTRVVGATLEKHKPWEYAHPGYSRNSPVVNGGDVYLLEGTAGSASEVVRLDALTGEVRWKWAMPVGAFEGGGDWADGSPAASMNGLGLGTDVVVALGCDRSIFLLESYTGRPKARTMFTDVPIALPQVVGDALVVASRTGAAVYSLGALCAPQAGGHADLMLLRAHALHALGRHEESDDVLGELLTARPDAAAAWTLRARVAGARGRAFEAVAATVRVMELGGQTESDDLRSRYGLIQRIPFGWASAVPVRVGDVACFASAQGEFCAVDVNDMKVRIRRTLPSPVTRFRAAGARLHATLDDRMTVALAQFGGPLGPDLDPDDVNVKADPAIREVPAAWHGGDGGKQRVMIGDRYVRPMPGGGTQVLTASGLTELRPRLARVDFWRIAAGANRAFGYDAAGILALDETFCPVRRVSGVPGPHGMSYDVALAVNADSVGFVHLGGDDSAATLEVRSADGLKVVAQRRFHGLDGRAGMEGRLLQAVEGGYLVAGRELIYFAGPPAARDWEFALAEPTYSSASKAATRSGHGNGVQPAPMMVARRGVIGRSPRPHFTAPIVAGGKVFVGHGAGGIYVFDLSAVTGAMAPTATTDFDE